MSKPSHRDGNLIDEDEAALFVDMSNTDALGLVIRSAIYVEQQLDGLIALLVVHPDALKRMKLSYETKGDLAIALGLIPRLRSPLTALGNIRNDFAHNLKSDLTDERVKALYDAFHGDDKQQINVTYERVRRTTHRDWPRRFNQVDTVGRYQILALTLRQAIKAARVDVVKMQQAALGTE